MTDVRSVLTMATTQAPSRIPDQPCVDCLDHSLAAERRRLAVPHRVAFWLLAFVFTATMLGTTLPTSAVRHLPGPVAFFLGRRDG